MSKYNDAKKAVAEKRRAAVRALREKGWEWPEIGRKYGVTAQRAQQIGKYK